MKETSNLEKLKYPIGNFENPEVITPVLLKEWSNEIELFPSRVIALVQNLDQNQLNWIYRPGGWNIRQVVHHCADSHMNAFIRFKLSLTEDKPTIRPYKQDKWAELADTTQTDVSESIKILEGVHARWTQLINSLNASDWKKEFIHPEYNKTYSLEEAAALYAWHANHHLAHIEQAIRNSEQI